SCPDGFNVPCLAPFMIGDGDERAHDSEGRDDDDKKKQKKHYIALESYRFEKLMIHFGPGLREHRWLEKLVERFLNAIGAVRIVGPNGDAVERVAQVVKLLRDVDRHEQELRVILIATGLKNAGDGQ